MLLTQRVGLILPLHPPGSLLRSCHWGAPTDSDGPRLPEGGHTTCWRATSVSSSSWQDPSPSASPHQRLQHSRGSAGDSTYHLPTGDHWRPDSHTFQSLRSVFAATNPNGTWTFCVLILDIVFWKFQTSEKRTNRTQSFLSPFVITPRDIFNKKMMEDHLLKIPMMSSASPTESSGSGGTDDSRGGKSFTRCNRCPWSQRDGTQTWPVVRKKSRKNSLIEVIDIHHLDF